MSNVLPPSFAGIGGIGGIKAAGGNSGAKPTDVKKDLKEQIGLSFYLIFKVVAILISVAVAWMITNNMAQLYTERVFVDEKNPPHLRNMVFMWAIFAFVCAVFIIFGAFASNTLGLGISKYILLASFYDAIIAFSVSAIVLYGIASIMYNKKYFYYKDDGLRGIRALRDMINWVSTAMLLLPAGYILSEYMAADSKLPSILKR